MRGSLIRVIYFRGGGNCARSGCAAFFPAFFKLDSNYGGGRVKMPQVTRIGCHDQVSPLPGKDHD